MDLMPTGGKTKKEIAENIKEADQLLAQGAPREVKLRVDDMDEIVGELTRLTSRFDVVLTSGGLGPTHDDITLKGVARALGMRMERSAEMAGIIETRFEASGKPCSAEILEKMATLPAGAGSHVLSTCTTRPAGSPTS